jgi:hypothetical protein
MDMGFTPFAPALTGATRFDAEAGLDWHALRASFAAAHAARRVLTRPSVREGGSFAPGAASELAHNRDCLHGVNLTDSNDRKSHGGMAKELAGTESSRERGPQ